MLMQNRIRDLVNPGSGSGMEKETVPGSGIKIPDPQHWSLHYEGTVNNRIKMDKWEI
jgi:hypothetical protein